MRESSREEYRDTPFFGSSKFTRGCSTRRGDPTCHRLVHMPHDYKDFVQLWESDGGAYGPTVGSNGNVECTVVFAKHLRDRRCPNPCHDLPPKMKDTGRSPVVFKCIMGRQGSPERARVAIFVSEGGKHNHPPLPVSENSPLTKRAVQIFGHSRRESSASMAIDASSSIENLLSESVPAPLIPDV